jgi:hypothetical protein
MQTGVTVRKVDLTDKSTSSVATIHTISLNILIHMHILVQHLQGSVYNMYAYSTLYTSLYMHVMICTHKQNPSIGLKKQEVS